MSNYLKSPRRRRLAWLAIAVGALFVVSGCATPTGPGTKPLLAEVSDVTPALVKNRDAWAMPLDSMRFRADNTVNYAENLAIAPCLSKSGYEWPVPWQDASELASPSLSPVGGWLFTPETAAVSGYHLATKQTESTKLWDVFVKSVERFSSNSEFDAMYSSCLADVRKSMPMPSVEDQLFVADLVAHSADAALLEESVSAAATRWRTCMETAQISDVSSHPSDMPSQQLRKKFDLLDGPAPAVQEVTPLEIRVATADAKCAETSGYSQALYNAQWKLQEEMLAQETDRLVWIYDQVTEQRLAALDIIGRLAPAMP
ncbi:hypothetical protein ACWPKO_29940 (plasmid) [Coraliomargarita sp. W4R53]